MQVHIFREKRVAARSGFDEGRIRSTLERVADGMDTSDLVVVLYLVDDPAARAGLYVGKPCSPSSFICRRGKWSISALFGAPPSLPEAYLLIRMCLGVPDSYPVDRRDRYGWLFRPKSFEEDCAILFAHELHHFRRRHLGLHRCEGEQSANMWALEHLQALGYPVDGSRPDVQSQALLSSVGYKSRNEAQSLLRKTKEAVSRLCRADLLELRSHVGYRLDELDRLQHKREEQEHIRRVRELPPDSRVVIRFDPAQTYSGEVAVILQQPSSATQGILVRTPDGKRRRFRPGLLRPKPAD